MDPMSFLHGDGHKVIPSNGGREVGENWGEKVYLLKWLEIVGLTQEGHFFFEGLESWGSSCI